MVAPIYFDAIVYSSILALLSIGLTLTYMTTKVPNFAHASLAMIGAYTTWTLVNLDRLSQVKEIVQAGYTPQQIAEAIRAYTLTPSDYIQFIIASFIITGIIAVLQYILVLKPLSNRGSSTIGLMIATIAVDMFIFAIINIYADYAQAKMVATINQLGEEINYRIPLIMNARDFVFFSYDKSPSGLQRAVYLSPLLLIIILTALHLLLTKTKLGVALRAAIENPSLAGVLGVNVNQVYTIAWFLSGGLAGIGGALLPLKFFTNPALGQILIVSIFAASIVGGLFTLYGAVIGGFLVGISETIILNLLVTHTGLNAGYRPMIPLIIMAITLLFLPQGIGGYNWKKLLKKR